VQDLTARDVKVAYLKNLQGYLWETGFKSGACATELFDDVVPQLQEWCEHLGLELAVYSSGSVFAQKLLFGHIHSKGYLSPKQDLTPLFSEYFDTTNAGSKVEKESYTKIAQVLEVCLEL